MASLLGAFLVAAILSSAILTGGARIVATEPPTYSGDAAPILNRHCVPCHHPGGPGPFSLASYDQARARARQIAEVTRSGFMPPWLPRGDGSAGLFVGERRLAPAEIETLSRWTAAGAPRGNAAELPSAPTPLGGWQLGEPDLELELPVPFVLPAEGADLFRNFVLRVPLDSERWVRAVEILPVDPRPIHHAVLTVDETPASRRLDSLDPEPGWSGMEAFTAAQSPDGQLLGWTPGRAPFAGFPDMAWRLRPGADLVLLLHLLPTGTRATVQVRLGLQFADTPPIRHAHLLRLGPKVIDIPAGEAAYAVEDAFELPVDAELLSIYPHAHYLGKTMVAQARRPDGTTRELLRIDDWDFAWQDQYVYRAPIPLPAGTLLLLRYTYDNSSQNARNPHQPPRRVRYGPSSFDEMADLWLQLVPLQARDLPILERASRRKELAARIDSRRFTLAEAPDDVEARLVLAGALLELGDYRRGIDELEELLRRRPDEPRAHTNLGNTLYALGRLEEANGHFRRAVELEPDRPEAHYNLANGLAAASLPEEAVVHYDQALRLQPDWVQAHLNRGIALSRLGRPEEELLAYREALRHRPDYVAAHYNLGQALARAGRFDDALASLERARELEPSSAPVLGARADTLLAAGRLEEAETAYRELIVLQPELADAHYGLGVTRARQERFDDARRSLERALELNSGHDGARAALAEISGQP